MGFSRQEYWSGLPFPSPGYLPNPGIKFASPALAGKFFSTELPGKPTSICTSTLILQQLYEVSWIIIPMLLVRGDCCSSTLNTCSLGCHNYQSNSRSGTLSCTLWYSCLLQKASAWQFWATWQRVAPKKDGSWWSSDKTWSTGEGNGKLHQYSCLENHMNSMKRQKYVTLKDELPGSGGAQYATGDQWRSLHWSRKNEQREPKQKQKKKKQKTASCGSDCWWK